MVYLKFIATKGDLMNEDRSLVFEKEITNGNRRYSFKVFESETKQRTLDICWEEMMWPEGHIRIEQEDIIAFDEVLLEAIKEQIKGIYPRYGLPWAVEEEEQLKVEVDEGRRLGVIADRHQRTPGSILTKVRSLKLLPNLSL
jgi:hypothetical protein